jgi:hypothetical protein
MNKQNKSHFSHRVIWLDRFTRQRAVTRSDMGEVLPPYRRCNQMSPYDAMRSNLQAVSPRIAARSASLKLGVPRMCSTAVLVHG